MIVEVATENNIMEIKSHGDEVCFRHRLKGVESAVTIFADDKSRDPKDEGWWEEDWHSALILDLNAKTRTQDWQELDASVTFFGRERREDVQFIAHYRKALAGDNTDWILYKVKVFPEHLRLYYSNRKCSEICEIVLLKSFSEIQLRSSDENGISDMNRSVVTISQYDGGMELHFESIKGHEGKILVYYDERGELIAERIYDAGELSQPDDYRRYLISQWSTSLESWWL